MALAAFLVAGGEPAPATRALILDAGEAAGATRPAPDDPGWEHVGRRWGGPSVVYLGRGWVLTAGHVGAGIVEIAGERYDPVRGSITRLRNHDGSNADLLLFRIVGNPELPALEPLAIANNSPRPGEDVLMIGWGHARGRRITISVPGTGLLDGWTWKADSQKRWGTNRVATWPREVEGKGGRTRAIVTAFDRREESEATHHEAQAATGDSGGALFTRRNPFDPKSPWWLSGVLFSITSRQSNPERSAFYGDLTYAVDLASYRDALFEAMRHAGSPPPSRERWPVPLLAGAGVLLLLMGVLAHVRLGGARAPGPTDPSIPA